MKKVYLLVECDVDDYPAVEQAKAGEMALDSIWSSLHKASDSPKSVTPWFDYGNGGMTVQGVNVISNLAVTLLKNDEASRDRLVRAQKEFEEHVAKYKKILEEGI